ncbi:MAG: sigma-54 dependent transcriptional regulator [Bacteroidota bacterium]
MEYIEAENINNYLQTQYGIVGRSKPMQDAINLLRQSAPTDLTVLITGETGTGKEIFAHALHGLSNRKKNQFVSVNCGAIPETLLESELFGHEKGAFTGATEQRKGFFEVADKGTIFLDEIGEMPVGTQVKLLRVLEAGEFNRLGSTNLKKVDVRVIAATNRDLEYEVKEGGFRQDLYFRLKSVSIVLPPLRKHIEDLPLLVEYFAQRVCDKLGIPWNGINDDALGVLRSLPWAGNIRELRNLIETAITLQKKSIQTSEILQRHIAPALPATNYLQSPKENALIPLRTYPEPPNIEMEIIFRSLLELKNDVNEIKRFLHSLNYNVEDLKESIINIPPAETYAHVEEVQSISEENLNIETMEKKMIETALTKYSGNRRKAAKALGLSERTLYRKISEYGINEQNYS